MKRDRINAVLVDFLNRICLNIPFCVEALFLSLTFVANQLRFLVAFCCCCWIELNLKKSAQDQVLANGAGKISADEAPAWVMSFEVVFAIIRGFTEKE